ncbi:MAG: hypothetical protein Q8P19_00035, partial [bacterium]|nr:hypothetical protein [bacterium]
MGLANHIPRFCTAPILALVVLITIAGPLSFDVGTLSFRVNAVEAANCTETANGVTLRPTTLPDGTIGCSSSANLLYKYDANGVLVGYGGVNDGIPFSEKQDEPALNGPTSCSGFLTSMSSPFTCMGRALAALTSATLIYAASWILTFSGMLFNWLVENTIIQFSAWYDSISVAVEQAWGAFRDIANILIIGIFTFTAI